MSDTPKIVTMSYGSFSCRLEGFEEPFEAMTAIARHLRHLVSDDPGFGAGPPRPPLEVDKLRHLAQSATGQRVEARIAGPVPAIYAEPAISGSAPDAKARASDADDSTAPQDPPPRQPLLVETGPRGTHRDGAKTVIVAPGFGGVDGADRLFAVTETRMSHEETARRRATIASLKAAVAARNLSPDGTAESRDTPDTEAQPAPVTQARRIAVDMTRLGTAPHPGPVGQAPDHAIGDGPPSSAQAPAPPPTTPGLPAGTAPPKQPNSLARLVARAALILQQQREGGTAAAENPVPPGPTTGARHDEDTALHGGRFALMLDQSDAVEIEDVIDLAAAYAMAEFGTPGFARARLLRIIAHATDGSISDADIEGAFDTMVRLGRFKRVARGTFELVPQPKAE